MDKDQMHALLRLVQRSPDIGDGWRRVSDTLWPHVQGLPSELAEYGDQTIRLTSEGNAVAVFA